MEAIAPSESCLHFTTTCHITLDTDSNIHCGENLRSQNTLITFLNSPYKNGILGILGILERNLHTRLSECRSKKPVTSLDNYNYCLNFRTYFTHQEMSVSAASFLRALYC